MIQISADEAQALLDAIQMHEKARPDFQGTDYTEDQWNAISGLIVKVR